MGQLVSVTHEPDADDVADVDVGEYCRHVESHLAQVNAGEIIRITGAGFELVRGWALEGIPTAARGEGRQHDVEQLSGRVAGRSRLPRAWLITSTTRCGRR